MRKKIQTKQKTQNPVILLYKYIYIRTYTTKRNTIR